MNVTWNLAFSPCIHESVVVFIRKPVFSGSKGNSMPPPSFSCNDVLLPAFVLVQKVPPPPTYTQPPEHLFVRCATKKKYQSKCFLYLFVGGERAKMAPSWGSFHFAWIRSVKISRELFLLWNWVSHFWSPETKRRQVKKCRLKDASGGTIDGNWIETPVLKHKSSNAARRYVW